MPSLLGKIGKVIIRNFANINPDRVKEKGIDLVDNLRGIEDVFKLYFAPAGYKLEKIDVEGLPVELFSKKKGGNDKLVFVLHGGAYVSRMAFMYRWMNRQYSRASGGGSVLHFDYRCAPEYKYPCALEDAVKAWDWAIERGYKEENIVTIGDSAGGHLNVSLLMKLRDLGKAMPKASVFLSPWLDMTASGSSYRENYKNDPLFGVKGYYPTEEDVDRLYKSDMFMWFGDKDPKDPYISPVYAELDSSFPTSYITVGGDEMLMSDSVTLYEKLKKAGVEAYLDVAPGMFHVYNLYRIFPESRRIIKIVNNFISTQLS